jgi:hypothetical protein
MMPKAECYSSYIGKRFGKLEVVEFSRMAKHSIAMVNVNCDCGCKKEIRLASLKSGRVVSCGCYKLNTYKERKLKHHGKGTDLYNIWCSIKQRCQSESCKSYPAYGGRGIDICQEWSDDFSIFRRWCKSNGYKKGLSIDRIDNDKGYYPDNCRWTNIFIQANNTRRNIFWTHSGERKTISEWARSVGIESRTLHDRVYKLGWEIDKALTTKVRVMSKRVS